MFPPLIRVSYKFKNAKSKYLIVTIYQRMAATTPLFSFPKLGMIMHICPHQRNKFHSQMYDVNHSYHAYLNSI